MNSNFKGTGLTGPGINHKPSAREADALVYAHCARPSEPKQI